MGAAFAPQKFVPNGAGMERNPAVVPVLAAVTQNQYWVPATSDIGRFADMFSQVLAAVVTVPLSHSRDCPVPTG